MSPSGKTTRSINSKEEPENNNAQVLKKIKEEFEHKYPNDKKRNLKLPSGINFMVDGNTVTMQLSKSCVCANMQVDIGAFESWALVLKQWGMYDKINIRWEKPDNIKDKHYRRFLFRLSNFNKDFEPWFSIDDICQPFLGDLGINDNKSYLLNCPSENRNCAVSDKPEAKLENQFVEGNLRKPLMYLTKASFIDRRLPVGVFENSVAEENAIFPGDNSAIDLWGISNDNELLLFELKAKKPKVSPKIGIISELYFYVCVMQMLREGSFKYENYGDARISNIAKTTKIRAYFLAQELHPLIDKSTLEELNKMESSVEYNFIKIINGDKLEFEFQE